MKYLLFSFLIQISFAIQAQDDHVSSIEPSGKPELTLVKEKKYYILKGADGKVYYKNIDSIITDDKSRTKTFLVRQNKKWGLISEYDDLLIPIKFDKIINLNNGFYEVTRNLKKGIYRYGKVVVACEQDTIIFSNLYRWEFFFKKDKYWGVYSSAGILVLPNVYEKIIYNGFTLELIKDNKKFYLIHEKIVPADLIQINKTVQRKDNYGSGIYLYKMRQEDKWGIAGKDLKFIIPPDYQDVLYLRQYDIFLVKQNNNWGITDFNKQPILPIIYDSIIPYDKSRFIVQKNSLMNFWDFTIRETLESPVFENIEYANDNYFKISLKNKKTLIDKNVKMVYPYQYEDIIPQQDFFVIKERGYYGVINIKAEVVIPIRYNQVNIYNNLVFIEQSGRHGILSLENNVLIPPIYSSIDSWDDYILLSDIYKNLKFKIDWTMQCLENCENYPHK